MAKSDEFPHDFMMPSSDALFPKFFGYPNEPINKDFVKIHHVKKEFHNKHLPKNVQPIDFVASFLPVTRKGPNYRKFCSNMTPLPAVGYPHDVIQCVKIYTSAPNWLCTKVNIALASDSRRLRYCSSFIKELKYSIAASHMNYTGTVFRGVDMSPSELRAIEQQPGPFFIPSFMSTSKSNPFLNKNTLISIDISPRWFDVCMEIQPYQTEYPEENEILFTCYNIYQHQKTEKSNGKIYMKLNIVDKNKVYDQKRNIIVPQNYPQGHHHHIPPHMIPIYKV